MSIMSGIYNSFYMPICRLYSRLFIKDKPADLVYRLLCSIQFRRIHGFWPNFARPQRFTEKLWSRMLHGRYDWLTWASDKERVRNYVAQNIGSQYLIPVHWIGADPEMIPFDSLPSSYVIKATHGCNYNIFVRDSSKVNRIAVRRQLRKWLAANYCEDYAIGIEWGYRNLKPLIIVETFIGEINRLPEDYKFYCFSGRVEFLTQHFDRFENHKTRSFDRNYGPHEFRYQFEQYGGECHRPPNFDEMVRVAESLAEPFGFIRVDLYNVNSRIYFGELTPYPGGVSTKFLPASLDRFLGNIWLGN